MELFSQKVGFIGCGRISMIPVLKGLRQEHCEFRANFSYMSRLYLKKQITRKVDLSMAGCSKQAQLQSYDQHRPFW